MPGEIDIDSPEGDVYKALKEKVPIVKDVVGNGIALVKLFYGISDSDQLEEAVEKLQREQSKLRAMLEAVLRQVNELTVEVAKLANRARINFIDEQLVELNALLIKLGNPGNDAHAFREIALEAVLRANELLEIERWLWSDVRTIAAHTDDFGNRTPATVERLPDRFVTVLALPAYSLALVIFVFAAARHISGLSLSTASKKREAIAGHYGEHLDRHIRAVSPAGWDDENPPSGNQIPWTDRNVPSIEPGQTLDELIRERIGCALIPHHNYSSDGKCWFDVYAIDKLQGTRKFVRTVELSYPEGGNHVLCTYPQHIAWSDEAQAEDESPDLQLVRMWSQTLQLFRSTGNITPGTPYIGRFPNFIATRATLYLAGHDGSLTARRQTWPRNVSDFDEELVVGSEWTAGKPFSGGGSIVYLGYPGGDWYWYRHEGAEQAELAPRWRPRRQVLSSPVGRRWFSNRIVFGGGDGILYGIVKSTEFRFLPNGRLHILHEKGDLMWMRHAGYVKGDGGFAEERKVGSGWDIFRHVFSVGEGVIYAILPGGSLRWYKHKGYLTGTAEWERWNGFGNGWQIFADVFSAGEGLIYARESSGLTRCYRDKAWRDGGGDFDPPVELVHHIPDQYAMFAALPGADFFRGPS